MANCGICGESVSLLTAKKTSDAFLCGNCLQKIPHVIHNKLANYDVRTLAEVAEYEANLKKNEFVPTASFGKLHIDEMSGLFAVSDKQDRNGNLVEPVAVFDCLYLNEIGLYPVNARQNHKDIVCDVELNCKFNYPAINFRLIVKQNLKCEYKQINASQATWSEPGEISMFRNMLDQTMKTCMQKAMMERQRDIQPFDVDIIKARAALHVAADSPITLIDQQFRRLTDMYQNSDIDVIDKDTYIKSLTKYYHLLVGAQKAKATE